MRTAVTGTPGTGKTSATERLDALDDSLAVVHLNDVIRDEGLSTGTDETRDSLVADVDAVERWLDDLSDSVERVVVDSHLAHHLSVDRVVVCRCHPDELGRRLEARDEPPATVAENEESEALDVILAEAVERHGLGSVYELETTDRTPEEVAHEIGAILDDEREPSAGDVSFLDALRDDR